MGDNKIDITSGMVEKGLDAAKAFLGKLVSPAAADQRHPLAPIKQPRPFLIFTETH